MVEGDRLTSENGRTEEEEALIDIALHSFIEISLNVEPSVTVCLIIVFLLT